MSALTPVPIIPPPGVVKTESLRVAEGRWSDCDKTRFVRARPQKIGGNIRLTNTVMQGTPRATHAWRDFAQNQYVGCASYKKVYVFDSAYALNDVTPFADTGTLGANPFTTTNLSTSVAVNHVAHKRSVGDTVIYSGASTFNNVTMNGTFTVASVANPNSYTVTAATQANASSSGGGAAVAFSYEISVGSELAALGQGWGVGPWGSGTWGTARGTSITVEPRVWSLDHFGQILLATYNGGTLYTFDPTQNQPWGRAVTTFGGVAMGAPSDFRSMFVTPERYVFGLCDNMVVKVCSQGDLTAWTPSISNTAFQRTLQEGNRLIGGRALAPFISLVWTDAALYLFQYTGSQFVYNSSLAGKDCGLISANAAVVADGVAYWMGADNFYMYAGGSSMPMPNVEDIRKYVFDAIPSALAYQCCAVFVPKFREIWFFYPTTGDTNPTRYVIYSIPDKCWAPGHANFYSSLGVTAGRASGSHFTQGDTSALMAGTDGYLYNHDPVGDTYNDNGQALPWSLSLAPYAFNEGLGSMDLEAILLDIKDQVGTIAINIKAWDRLNDATPMDTDSATVAAADNPYTEFRVSGRYVEMDLSASAAGNYFRLGKPVAFVRRAGKRS